MNINYSTCPACTSSDITAALRCEDYTVSYQLFSIMKCNTCTLLFTRAVPDQNEIGAYYQSDTYISHSDTQRGLVNLLYHRVRKYTLAAKCKLVINETQLPQGKILDIGCGTGAFLNAIQQKGWQVTGLEPDYDTRLKAKQLYNLSVLPANEIYKLIPYTYHAITMWHVLEHVHELHKYLATIKKLLTPNGTLIIALPNYTSYDAQHFGQYWAAYDVPRHLYHFSPLSMHKLVEQHGMVVKKIKPMWFDSFYVSMLSSGYKKDSLHQIKGLWIGLVSNLKALFNTQKCSSLIYIIEHKK